MIRKVNIKEKLASFNALWTPHVVGDLNEQHVKVVKLKGQYVWHQHENEDELFLVIRGQMQLHLRDSVIELNAGEFVIVPRGVEHKPVAAQETHVLLFEPASTRNTGNVDCEFTIEPRDIKHV
ncbi:MAG TPA: cupin domain-containing protein [candidate division Zixibacteria bacterium]|nr:cupin domain-containing protein [candidate division Zixibacteria bacterium]